MDILRHQINISARNRHRYCLLFGRLCYAQIKLRNRLGYTAEWLSKSYLLNVKWERWWLRGQ